MLHAATRVILPMHIERCTPASSITVSSASISWERFRQEYATRAARVYLDADKLLYHFRIDQLFRL
jgi:hypothetical protein